MADAAKRIGFGQPTPSLQVTSMAPRQYDRAPWTQSPFFVGLEIHGGRWDWLAMTNPL